MDNLNNKQREHQEIYNHILNMLESEPLSLQEIQVKLKHLSLNKSSKGIKE